MLVKLCRHTATSHGVVVTATGWVTIRQALTHVNMERENLLRRSRKGKGRGGGNAPPSNLDAPFTVDEVITIVSRAVRPHLGLMENHAGEITWIRAWEYHAGLRAGQTLRDYELESLRIDPVVGAERLPRVGLIPMTTGA